MWDSGDEDSDQDDGGRRAAINAEWEEKEEEEGRRLRTAAGIHEALQAREYGTPGPGGWTWDRAVNLLVEDLADAVFALGQREPAEGGPDSLRWQRAAVAFTWPLVDATPERAVTPCRVRVWTSPGVPEAYEAVHDGSGGDDAFALLGARLSALRTWDATEPWNTYLVLIVRQGAESWSFQDCAWWQARPADYFAKPEAIVASLARMFPPKGWTLASSDR